MANPMSKEKPPARFIVSETRPTAGTKAPAFRDLTLPNGDRARVMSRDSFSRAIKAAVSVKNKAR